MLDMTLTENRPVQPITHVRAVDQRRTIRWLVAGAAVLLAILRMKYALHTPYALAPDEAYTWEWARHPDWGYYDMGPMVAWSTAVSLKFFGVTEFAMRLVPILYSLATSLLYYELGLEVTRRPLVAATAVLLFNITPIGAAGSIINTYYSQQIFFWVLSLLLFRKALLYQKLRWWIAWGVSAGAGLLSHHTSFVLNGLLLLYLALSKSHRIWWRRPSLYIGGAVALLLFWPLLRWNLQHGMPMFRHGPGQTGTTWRFVQTFGDFLGGQLGVITPFIWLAAIAAMVRAGWKGFKGSDQSLFLFTTSAPVLIYVASICVLGRTEANWPVSAYITGFITLALWYWERPRSWRMHAFATISVALAMAGSILIHFPGAVSMIVDLPPQKDPVNRLYGWRELGEELTKIRADMPASFLCAMDFATPGELSFYTEGHPAAYCLPVAYRRSQFTYWNINQEIGRDAIYVKNGDGALEPSVQALFKSVSAPEYIVIRKGANGPARKVFTIFCCRYFKGYFGKPPDRF